MSKCEIIKLNKESNDSQPLFDTYEENDLFGELKDKSITIKVHRVGTNRILLDIPTQELDREDYWVTLIPAAVGLIKKGVKVYKQYVDKKSVKTPKPEAFKVEASEPKETTTTENVVKAVTEQPKVAKILEEYPVAKKMIEENPNNVGEYFQEYLNEAEETGDLDDILTGMYDEIGTEIIKALR